MLEMTTGLDVLCARCNHTRHEHEAGHPYPGCVHRDCYGGQCEGFVAPTWDYSEPTRIDELLQRIGELSVGKAEDPITPEERAQIAEAQRKKAEELNESLKKHVEQGKPKK